MRDLNELRRKRGSIVNQMRALTDADRYPGQHGPG
jgi:hypothetical protein